MASTQTLIKVNDWNAYLHLPSDYATNSAAKYPTIIFIPGLGEVGTDANRVIANGPGAYIKQGWNGEVLGIKFIIISLQPPTAWPGAASVKNRVDLLKAQYRIGSLYMTGLSMGGWASMTYATAYPTELRNIVSVEGVDIGYGTDINQLWKDFSLAGGKMVNFEQVNDYRVGDKAVAAMNNWTPGSAEYVETNFGGGGHCCWNEFYGGGGKKPGIFNLGGIEQTLYEWIARDYLAVLPDYLGKVQIKGDELSWSCENIEEGSHFVIEESYNGVSFQPIGSVQAEPNLSKYSFNL